MVVVWQQANAGIIKIIAEKERMQRGADDSIEWANGQVPREKRGNSRSGVMITTSWWDNRTG